VLAGHDKLVLLLSTCAIQEPQDPVLYYRKAQSSKFLIRNIYEYSA